MANEINIYQKFGKGYENAFFTNCGYYNELGEFISYRYRVFCGGRNTKKSYDMFGAEPLLKIMMDERRNIIMIRQNDSDNAQSTYANLINIISAWGINNLFQCKTNPREIVYKRTGQKIIFRGFNNPTGLTSVKFEHGYLTDFYFEEASEIRSYEDFRKADGSLRGRGIPLQITLALNPWDVGHWTYEVFFKGKLEDDFDTLEARDYMDKVIPDFNLGFGKGLYLHKSTYKINEFRDPSYDQSMMYLRANSPDIYKVEGLGMWGNSTDGTYPEMSDSLIIPRAEANNMKYVDFAIGIDTGLSDGQGKIYKNATDERRKSATVMELVGLTRDFTTLVSLQEYYFSNEGTIIRKTPDDIQNEILDKLSEWVDLYRNVGVLMKGRIRVYVDSADIGFRQTLEMNARKRRDQNLYNIEFVASTKIPILTRVYFTRHLMTWGEYKISEACPQLIREIKNSHKGQNGEVRENFDDHSLNANEYAWAVLRTKVVRWGSFKAPTAVPNKEK